MTVYSFYIFDRHTECVYKKDWVSRPQSASHTDRPLSQSSATTQQQQQAPQFPSASSPTATQHHNGPSSTLDRPGGDAAAAAAAAASKSDDDAKLIYGTVFSLRNMCRKLGGEDDAFISYRTASYKLHYYETPANLRFVMLTDTGSLSMRNVLHQIYINLWVEYVVKNPLAPVEHKGGAGVRNELFELGLDQFIRGLM